jgi:hypothetical protein
LRLNRGPFRKKYFCENNFNFLLLKLFFSKLLVFSSPKIIFLSITYTVLYYIFILKNYSSTVLITVQYTLGCENVDGENIEEWFQVDCAVPGRELRSDEEIVKRAQGINDSSDDDEEESTLIPDKRISHSSALEWTEHLLDYLVQQDDALLSDKLLLRKLRSTIRKKESASLKLKTIKDYYFNYNSVQFRNFV